LLVLVLVLALCTVHGDHTIPGMVKKVFPGCAMYVKEDTSRQALVPVVAWGSERLS